MQVRRNYREPFFREKRRPFPWRNVILILLFFGVILYYLWSQPSLVTDTAYALLGNAPTPTPLPRELVEQANNAVAVGDVDEALALFEQALVQRPDNPDYLYEYGQLLVDADRGEDALTVANRLSDIAPNDVRSYTLKTRAMAWLGQSAAAIPIGLAGLDLNPNYGPLYEALSRAYGGEARWRDALDAGLMATEKDSANPRSYWAYASALTATGNYDQAITEFQTAIQLDPTFLPPYFELAFLYLSLDRNQDAIDMYDRILAIQPRNSRALLRQCEAYRKVGEFERAIGLCQDAVDSDPTFIPAQFRLGLLRYSRREFPAAQTAFDICLSAQSDNLECRYMLGLSFYYLQDCDQAWTLLNESLRIATNRSDSDTAIKTINEGINAILNDPNCPAYYIGTPEVTPEATPDTGFVGDS